MGLRWWLIVMVTLGLCGLGFAAGWWQGEPVPGRSLGVYSGAPAARGAALLVLLAYVLLVNGFGEEVGWRGFLAHHLLARWGRLRAASAVWLAWALWHAPLFLVGGSAIRAPALVLAGCAACSRADRSRLGSHTPRVMCPGLSTDEAGAVTANERRVAIG
ncbi:CPBP family intramembrane glutamic endopeptidase [Nocardioides sp.]|uniref:CPBP family intramembrane glutamic endopeptidase n=1 Tax=Nocardioides sp. TaxID=35761 RepID=UPI002ECFB27D